MTGALSYARRVNATVVVAALGFFTTLLSVWLTSSWQHRNARSLQLLNAKVRVYGECAQSLYEFERATYNRVKTRLEGIPEEQREVLRQEAFRANAAARAAIGQLGVLSSAKQIRAGLDAVRRSIGELNWSAREVDLKALHEDIYGELDRLLDEARSDLSA